MAAIPTRAARRARRPKVASQIKSHLLRRTSRKQPLQKPSTPPAKRYRRGQHNSARSLTGQAEGSSPSRRIWGRARNCRRPRKKVELIGIKPENIFTDDAREEFVRDFVFWFAPEHEMLQAAIDKSLANVTGTTALRLKRAIWLLPAGPRLTRFTRPLMSRPRTIPALTAGRTRRLHPAQRPASAAARTGSAQVGTGVAGQASRGFPRIAARRECFSSHGRAEGLRCTRPANYAGSTLRGDSRTVA